MNYKDLAEIIKSGIHPVVTFKKAIEDKEDYTEGGMRARIIGVDDCNDDVLTIRVDYSEFEEFNKQYETSNYFDKQGNPTWNARQAGLYKPQDKIYVDADVEISLEMEIESAENLKLYDRYKSEAAHWLLLSPSSPQLSYVQWLENKLIASLLREDNNES